MTEAFKRIGGALAALTLMAFAAPALAPDAAPAPPPEAVGVSQAGLAAELAAWGRRHDEPGALILAARVLNQVPRRGGEGRARGGKPAGTR